MDNRTASSPCPFCGHLKEFLNRTGKRICANYGRTRGYEQLLKPIQIEQGHGLENNLKVEELERR